jgi:ribosome maturation factor RimP
MSTENDLESIISPLLDGLSLSLVEMSIGRHRGDVKINLVLYKDNGIGLDDLTKAQKILRPRLELEFDRDNLSMEISSPGMSRLIKSPKEYRIFTGRKMRFLLDEEWIEGTLTSSNDEMVFIQIENEELEIPVKRIRKAKLD